MDDLTKVKIARFQDGLPAIRKAAGWSAEDLGEILDVTRQTIVNLETKQTAMTKVQYLALRSVFKEEPPARENETVSKLITTLVDLDQLDEKDRVEIKRVVNEAAQRVGRRAGAAAMGAAIVPAVTPLLAGIALAASAGAIVSALSDIAGDR